MPWADDIILFNPTALIDDFLSGSWNAERLSAHASLMLSKKSDEATRQLARGMDGDALYNFFMQRGCYRLAGSMGYIAHVVTRWLRRGALERGFEALWRLVQPDLVVSFVPFVNGAMGVGLSRACPHARIVTVVTDMAQSVRSHWFDPFDPTSHANHFVVAGSALMQAQARRLGYAPPQLLCTSGLVIHPAYYHDDGASDDHRPLFAVLFFGGFAPMRTLRIAKRLLADLPDASVRIAVLCGGNASLEARLREELAGARCVVEGKLPPERVRAYLTAAKMLIGKPGPGVVSEASVCGVPVVTERNAMPQEQCVLEWLSEHRVGVLVDSLEALPADVLQRAEACRAPLRALENRAVFELTKHLRELVEKQQQQRPTSSGGAAEEDHHYDAAAPRPTAAGPRYPPLATRLSRRLGFGLLGVLLRIVQWLQLTCSLFQRPLAYGLVLVLVEWLLHALDQLSLLVLGRHFWLIRLESEELTKTAQRACGIPLHLPPPLHLDTERDDGADDGKEKDRARAAFDESLERIIEALNTRGTCFSRAVHRGGLIKLLHDRMKIVRYHAARPALRDKGLTDRPIFVVGLPRTGTTLLQTLLSLDSRSCRALAFWETFSPVPDEAHARYDPLAEASVRLEEARLALLAADTFLYPEQPLVTGVRHDSLVEDWYLLNLGLVNPLHMGSVCVCGPDEDAYYAWATPRDDDDGDGGGRVRLAYQFFRHALQVVCDGAEAREAAAAAPAAAAAAAAAAAHPPPRLLLKCPEHLWSLDALFAAFPDAQVVWTHRAPSAAISSYCTQASALVRINEGKVDPSRVGPSVARCLLDGCGRGQAAAERHREQVCDVSFEDLCADPANETRCLKRWLGLPHDAQSEQRLVDFLDKGGLDVSADDHQHGDHATPTWSSSSGGAPASAPKAPSPKYDKCRSTCRT